MVAHADSSTPLANTSFYTLSSATTARLSVQGILATRAGLVEYHVVRELSDDQRRTAAAARVADEQFALIEREDEPQD